jgi:hypothetical protein
MSFPLRYIGPGRARCYTRFVVYCRVEACLDRSLREQPPGTSRDGCLLLDGETALIEARHSHQFERSGILRCDTEIREKARRVTAT